MSIRERCYRHVEEYFANVPGTEINLLQLPPGPLDFRSTQVDLV
jgi:hypothetical protein